MKKVTYQDQLKMIEWRRRRAKFILASGSKCKLCGQSNIKHLVVHHKKYLQWKMAWEYDNEDLICICKECHGKIHNSDLIIKQMESTKINSLLTKTFESWRK